MRLIEHDHVIQAFATNRADYAFGVRIRLSSRLHRPRAIQHKPFGSRIPSIPCKGVRFV